MKCDTCGRKIEEYEELIEEKDIETGEITYSCYECVYGKDDLEYEYGKYVNAYGRFDSRPEMEEAELNARGDDW